MGKDKLLTTQILTQHHLKCNLHTKMLLTIQSLHQECPLSMPITPKLRLHQDSSHLTNQKAAHLLTTHDPLLIIIQILSFYLSSHSTSLSSQSPTSSNCLPMISQPLPTPPYPCQNTYPYVDAEP